MLEGDTSSVPVSVITNCGRTSLRYIFCQNYFIKDHLGNVRMVLTDEKQTDIYPIVSLENANSVALENTYYNINTGNIVSKSAALNIPDYTSSNGIPTANGYIAGGNSQQLYMLDGNNPAARMGLGITLKVMAGDTVTIFGKSYCKTAAGTGVPGSPISIPLLDLLNRFVGAGIPGNKGAVTGGLPLHFQRKPQRFYSLGYSFRDTAFEFDSTPYRGECILPYQSLQFKVMIAAGNEMGTQLSFEYLYIPDFCYNNFMMDMHQMTTWYLQYKRDKKIMQLPQ